jgi:hypothetical protein
MNFRKNMSVIGGLLVCISTLAGCGSATSESSPLPTNQASVSSAVRVTGTNSTERSPSQSVSTSAIASLQRQVQLLQQAVAPQSPQDAANTWAKAIQTRNGALQFAILTPQLQNKMRKAYESCNWVTGVSSPWIEKYTIDSGKKTGDGQYCFLIRYTLTDSTRNTRINSNSITVTQIDGKWYVSDTGKDGLSVP